MMKYEYKAVLLDWRNNGCHAGIYYNAENYETYLNEMIGKFSTKGWEYVNYTIPGYDVPNGVIFIRRESK